MLKRTDDIQDDLLKEAISMLKEYKEGFECLYCDRNYGKEFDGHKDSCRLKLFFDKVEKVRAGVC